MKTQVVILWNNYNTKIKVELIKKLKYVLNVFKIKYDDISEEHLYTLIEWKSNRI